MSDKLIPYQPDDSGWMVPREYGKWYAKDEVDACIAELQAEVADLSRRLTTESRRVLIQQRDDARAEVERLRADAERYRWLREYNTVRHPEVTEAFFLGDANLDAALDAARGEAVAFQKAAGLENTPTEFTLPFRQAVEGTGYLAHEWKDKPHRLIFDLCRYIERNDAAPPAALPEPLFLLHTGAVYGNERGDWEIEANSGKAVDAYCDANPGKTVGLYLATQAPPAPAVPEGYALVPVEDLKNLAFTDFGRAFWTDGAEAAALRIRAMLAVAQAKG